ncbi:MAG: 16S rRNA (guanine(966)-N(2))-methyltransferase RsmD [Candidatus Omnitrophica bacterium]|jgi:16S rRNA (guanine(966)-N(2))-methyltransferase RsmD|nr:16S rRNA (guanine(966)-N(2))-methyltransferase RsmD [Candidatus Omnitrophota bacterium]
MKIIAGEFKGRKIKIPSGIRPVSLRIKKSCFDILGIEVRNKRILDLFSGSGSLGLEALSRGANEAIFVDFDKRCLTVIKENVSLLGLGAKTEVYLKDVSSAIKDFSIAKEAFDIIFIDPPYYQGILRKTLQVLKDYDILANFGFIIAFCFQKDDYLRGEDFFPLVVDKKYGQSRVLLYQKP